MGTVLIHLVGPEYVSITAKDKKILLECSRIFETLGEFAAEFGGGTRVLKSVCKEMYDFFEIASWYKLASDRKKLLLVFGKIYRACARFKAPNSVRNTKKQIRVRQAVVRKYWEKSKELS